MRIKRTDMTSGIIPKVELKKMVKAMREADAPVKEHKGEGHVIEVTTKRGHTIFWAMSHSSGNNYLVRYHKDLFLPKESPNEQCNPAS